jgi:hypothetical protein
MQISRECPMRAAILSSIAKDAPELEIQLLYAAKEHLTLATISEQLNAGTDRAGRAAVEKTSDDHGNLKGPSHDGFRRSSGCHANRGSPSSFLAQAVERRHVVRDSQCGGLP